jgi:trehalose-6-phosphate synthase
MWKPGDLVWIHDYHLIMLPEILRRLEPKIRMGFFLHIPFPSSEIFSMFPKRKSILTGMLNCDMIGFHTYDYARHFMSGIRNVNQIYFLKKKHSLH